MFISCTVDTDHVWNTKTTYTPCWWHTTLQTTYTPCWSCTKHLQTKHLQCWSCKLNLARPESTKTIFKKRFCFAFFVSIFVCFIFFSPYRKLKCYQYWGSDQGSVSSSGQNVIYQVKNLSENCDVEADRISVSWSGHAAQPFLMYKHSTQHPLPPPPPSNVTLLHRLSWKTKMAGGGGGGITT